MQRILSFLLFLLSAATSFAAIQPITGKIQGSGINPTASFTVEESKYQYMTVLNPNWTQEFDNVNVQNRIRLRYEESARTYYSAPWTIEVQCTVERFSESGTALTAQPCTLNISYDPGAGIKYSDNSVFVTSDGHKVTVTVDNVIMTGSICPGGTCTMPTDVLLETEIEVERYWFFNLSSVLHLQNVPTVTSDFIDNADNTMEFQWNYLAGAEEYDLEWLFISHYDAASQTPAEIDRSFSQGRAARVTLTDNHYKINLVYDKGFIVYRVRGVGRMGANFSLRAEGVWSTLSPLVAIKNLDQQDDTDDERNWQYTSSYAEEGKVKEVLSFFDGSLRNRQAVTKLNTENAALISETMYDYEGRAAVQTLPAPDQLRDPQLKFYTDYSLNTNTIVGLYSRREFDHDDIFGTSCKPQQTKGMNTSEGASRYYSIDNTFDDGFNAALPDAELYPFTQTLYWNDGRIRSQSGVGKNHTLSSTHQTNYFYARPSQEKLDRLFGNEAGSHQHYSQKVVQDANGQVSVSYEDLSGKVVATALAGNTPANLNTLLTNAPISITEDFSNLNDYIKDNESFFLQNEIMVTSPGTAYHFEYTMTPAQFQSICVNTTYNCKYDLTFTVLDNQCNTVMSGITVSVVDGSGTTNYPGFPTTVIMSNTFLTAEFDITFPDVGTYTIEKRISLNQAEMNAALTDFKSKLPGTCYTDPGFSFSASCGEDCEAFCVAHPADCIPAECDVLVNDSYCDDLYLNMRRDMKPGGQYFNNISIPASNAWLEYTGVDRTSMQTGLPPAHTGDRCSVPAVPGNPASTPPHTWPNGSFSTEALNAWTAANFRKPDNSLITTWADLRANWVNGWEEKEFDGTGTSSTANDYLCISLLPSGKFSINGKKRLVEFHPEYCSFEWCEATETSSVFEAKLTKFNTIASAPFLNLTVLPKGKSILDNDPYFSGVGAGDYNAMYNSTLGTGYLVNNLHGFGGMWDEANHISQNIDPAACTDCNQTWQAFRALYLSRKHELMHARKETVPCYSPCDATTPPDNIGDGCARSTHFPITPPVPTSLQEQQLSALDIVDQSTLGFFILVPEFSHLANNVYTTNTTPPNDPQAPPAGWNNQLNTNEGCRIPASATLDILSRASGCSTITITASSSTLGFTNIPLTDGTCCMNVTSMQSLAVATVRAINNFISSPLDFTAAPDPSDTTKFIIYAPASAGANGNTITINVTSCATFTNTFPQSMSGGSDNGTCPEFADCFCTELDQFSEEYAASAALQAAHANVETYIAFALNQAFNPAPAITTTQVQNWLTNCANTDGEDPTGGNVSMAVPAAVDCNEPESCLEDLTIIASYWHDIALNKLKTEAINSFIAAYKDKCLFGLKETMKSTHDDREYHYTLYYYDQAGNLVNTVPPAGVKLLNNTEIAQVQDHRNGVLGVQPVLPLRSGVHHRLITNYHYNTLDQVVDQQTPDGGTVTFLYDKVGRIVASRNDKQANSALTFTYSYTLYDGQGRIKEVGQMGDGFTALTPAMAEDPAAFLNFYNNAVKDQITRTFYDESISGNPVAAQFPAGQQNLRQRVASTTIDDNGDGNYEHGTHYSYDIHGNVNELVQENATLAQLGSGSGQQQYKKTDYEYDLVSGNVNEVHYQGGKADQFHHRYEYDADNRITRVKTSKDQVIWDNDAKYFYYLHGPLARTEIGDRSVQGMDYAYTIQGWVKGVNSNQLASAGGAGALATNPDIGRDAVNDDGGSGSYVPSKPNLHNMFGADGFGYTLSYSENGTAKDYKPVNTITNYLVTDVSTQNIPANDLFNGNIKQMATALMRPNPNDLPTAINLIANQYRYDQLNRLATAQAFLSSSNYGGALHNGDLDNTFTYDANGNIITQVRNGASLQAMDDLTYHYYLGDNTTYLPDPAQPNPLNSTNKLASVADVVNAGNYADDIDNQSNPNYTYDPIGNLISDAQEEIANIEWTVYGKVKKITRTTNNHNKPDLEFAYDASGNRIMKIVKERNAGVLSQQEAWIYTYYVRDAQGNILSTYDKIYTVQAGSPQFNEVFDVKEKNVFGSSRLGIVSEQIPLVNASFDNPGGTYNPDNTFANITGYTANNVAPAIGPTYNRELGNKLYEMTNHLGNVLTTVADRKLPVQSGSTTLVAFYLPDVVSSTDYSAFGAPLPGRQFNLGTYRFGMGGQEMDNEVSGNGNSYTAEFWQYDSRLGRRWNNDPIVKPWESPYAAFSNNPIYFIDPTGAQSDDPKKSTSGGDFVRAPKEEFTADRYDFASHSPAPKTGIIGTIGSFLSKVGEFISNVGKGVSDVLSSLRRWDDRLVGNPDIDKNVIRRQSSTGLFGITLTSKDARFSNASAIGGQPDRSTDASYLPGQIGIGISPLPPGIPKGEDIDDLDDLFSEGSGRFSEVSEAFDALSNQIESQQPILQNKNAEGIIIISTNNNPTRPPDKLFPDGKGGYIYNYWIGDHYEVQLVQGDWQARGIVKREKDNPDFKFIPSPTYYGNK